METDRTYLDTSDGMATYAARYGAKRDPVSQKWYVEGEVPHEQPAVCAWELADRVHHTARLTGMAVARNQRASFIGAHACRLLK